MKTPEQRQELVAKVEELIANGDMKVTEACEKLKISPVSYRSWKEGKTSYKGYKKTHGYKKAQHKIIIHEAEPIKRRGPKPQTVKASSDCVIIFCPAHEIGKILAGARP